MSAGRFTTAWELGIRARVPRRFDSVLTGGFDSLSALAISSFSARDAQ
jgi:hypothetical protein